jgi:hypothetical protein
VRSRSLRPLFAAGVAGLLLVLAPGAAGSVPRPALGDWEGVGPHGLPLSYVLHKRHGRVVISNLVIGFPVNCPANPTPFVAEAFKSASYSGPGAQPRLRFRGWKPYDVQIQAFISGQLPLVVFGRERSARRVTLSTGVARSVPKHCGWPSKKVTWNVRPRKRLVVATGTWTGTVSVPNGSGTVTAKVIAAGRIVNLFAVEITCTEGGGGGFSSGPPAGEFIGADGRFQGWGGAHWQGSFGADGTLSGTFFAGDYCGTSGQAAGTFTAKHSGPR